MTKSNVIVLGPSGVGKSTLINAVVGEEIGSSLAISRPYSKTPEIEVHDCEEFNIRLVDTVGFEPSAAKQKKAIQLVQKWTKSGAKKKDEEKSLDLVWFCVDGTSRRIFGSYIDNFIKAVKIWKNIPVIVVITKSYSELERQENVEAIRTVFEKYSEKINLKDIIPVVAMPYNIQEDIIVSTSGLHTLMERTLEVLPEGKDRRVKTQSFYSLGRKRLWSRGITMASATAAAGVGLTKLNFSASTLLEPIESNLIDQIAKQYELENDERIEAIKRILIASGTVGVVAKKVAELSRNIPEIKVKGVQIKVGRVANAVIASSIVVGLGESTRTVFEKIYMGEESEEGVEWIENFLENEASDTIVNNVKEVLERLNLSKIKKISLAEILTVIKDVFFPENEKE